MEHGVLDRQMMRGVPPLGMLIIVTEGRGHYEAVADTSEAGHALNEELRVDERVIYGMRVHGAARQLRAVG